MPRVTYPRPPETTGNGTIQEIKPQEWLIRWRDENDASLRRTVPGSRADALWRLQRWTRNRARKKQRLPLFVNWDDGVGLFERHVRTHNDPDADFKIETVNKLRESLADYRTIALLTDITEDHLEGWAQAQLKSRRLAKHIAQNTPENVARKIRAVAQFFKFLDGCGVIERNPGKLLNVLLETEPQDTADVRAALNAALAEQLPAMVKKEVSEHVPQSVAAEESPIWEGLRIRDGELRELLKLMADGKIKTRAEFKNVYGKYPTYYRKEINRSKRPKDEKAELCKVLSSLE